MRHMIIDFHTHVVPPGIKERRDKYLGRDACFSLLYAEPKAKLITAKELITAMDEYEINRSVILNLGWTSHELCVETNDYILESISRYPERLIGFCAIQPLAKDKAIKELERCAQNGAKGIGEMRPDVQGFDLKEAAARAKGGQHLGLWSMRERIEQLGGRLQIESQPGSGTTIQATVPLRIDPVN